MYNVATMQEIMSSWDIERLIDCNLAINLKLKIDHIANKPVKGKK